MNIRVEDLPLIPQGAISSGTLLYVSNSGVPYGMNLQIFGSGISGVISPLIVYTTGNQTIGGVKVFSNPIRDNANANSVDTNSRFLLDPANQTSIDWNNRFTYDTSGNQSIRYNIRQLAATGINGAFGCLNWDGSVLQLTNQSGLSVDWRNNLLSDFSGHVSLNYQSKRLFHVGGVTLDWDNYNLINGNSAVSLDWNNQIISGNWNSNNLNLSGNIVATAINLQTTGTTLYNYITGLSGVLTGISNNIIEGVKVLRTQKRNFGVTGSNYIFTVPIGYLFNIDAMEVITSDVAGTPTVAPGVTFGNSGNLFAYYPSFITASTGLLNRDIRNNPSDTITGGITLTASILTGTQGAASQSGYLVFRGYLMRNQ